MAKLSKLSRWLGPLGEVIVRAPVPVLAAIALTAALYAGVHADLSQDEEIMLVAVTTAGLLASILGQAVGGSLLALVCTALGAAASYWSAPLMVDRIYFPGALFAAALAGPLIGGPQSPQTAWRRFVRQAAALVLAVLGAVIVAAGVFLAEVSIEALFRLNVADFTERYVLPAAIGLVAPLVFLALAADKDDTPDDRISEALGVIAQTFARLVLLPLLAIYAAVLAAYAGRVILLQTIPSGEVGWIVPLFATSGAVTFMALGAVERPGFVSGLFLRIWFWLTLPAIALYAAALAIRVDAYGLTPQRYLAVLVGVWLLAIALGFVVGGRRSDIRLIPVTAALVLLLGTVGPWSMVPLVTRSQTDRLQTAFVAGAVAPALRAMSTEERRSVCSSVRILDRLERLGPLETALKVGETGLTGLCLAPFGSTDPTIKVDFDSDEEVLQLADGRMVWGPHRLYPNMQSLSAEAGSETLSLAVVGTALVVSVGADRHTFDLAAAARAYQADPTEGDLNLRSGRVTVVVRSLHMLLPPQAPSLRYGRIFVVTAPPPEPTPDAAADGDAAAPDPPDPPAAQ